jgi:hypothetical protein
MNDDDDGFVTKTIAAFVIVLYALILFMILGGIISLLIGEK